MLISSFSRTTSTSNFFVRSFILFSTRFAEKAQKMEVHIAALEKEIDELKKRAV